MPRKSFECQNLTGLKYPYTTESKQEKLQKKWNSVEIVFNKRETDIQSVSSAQRFIAHEVKNQRQKEERELQRQEKRKYLNFVRKKDEDSKVLMIIPKSPIRKPKAHVWLDKARWHRILGGGIEVETSEGKVRQVSVAPLHKTVTTANFSLKKTVFPDINRNGSAISNGKLQRRESVKAQLERRKSLVAVADKHRRRASILTADRPAQKEKELTQIRPDFVQESSIKIEKDQTNSPRSVKSLKSPDPNKCDRNGSRGSIWDVQRRVDPSPIRTKGETAKVKTSVDEPKPDIKNNSTVSKTQKVPLINQNVAYYLINGQVKMSPAEERRRYRRRRLHQFHNPVVYETNPREEVALDAAKHPVKALDASVEKLDRFIKENLKEDELLYRQKLMPKFFKKNESLRKKCHTLQQALKVQELLECLRENKKPQQMKEIRVSPDGASCPDTDCDCDCHHKANLKKGKGKGKGKSSKPKAVCERGQDGIMVCCCGKKPEPEEIIVITPEPEVVEPEILIETCDVEIQVDVKELKNNVSDVKPKRPRFVSVYLEAPDENTPRYMLAKNIHHKDRTQYTYIENKPHTTGEHWETSVNNKHTVHHRGNSSSNDPHVTSASTIIQVKESDSAHDFSDRDVIEDCNPGDISIDSIHNDGSKWNRGVDTEDLATDDPVNEFASSPQPEQCSTQDIHNHEISTNDSGIENIDLDSVSEVETQSQPSGKREIRRPVYVKPEVVYDSGTPGAISKVDHIPVEKVKGEPVVPKNRGTIIDYTKRLKEIKRIYDPYGIDLEKVKVNKHGELVYMRGSKSRSDSRETPQTRTEFLETSMSVIRNSPILENENTQPADSDNDTGQIDQKNIDKSPRSTRRNSVASSINQDPNSLLDKIEVVSPANANDSPSSDSRNSNDDQDSGQQDDESREQVIHAQIDDESPPECPISNEKDHLGDPEISKAEDTPTDTANCPLSCQEPERQENNPEFTTNNYIPSNHQPILV